MPVRDGRGVPKLVMRNHPDIEVIVVIENRYKKTIAWPQRWAVRVHRKASLHWHPGFRDQAVIEEKRRKLAYYK